MREDARFIIWAYGSDSGSCGLTVDSNYGRGYDINDARKKADEWVKKAAPTLRLYLLRMEHEYVQPTAGHWKSVG